MKNIIENEVGAILTDILDDYKKGRAVDNNHANILFIWSAVRTPTINPTILHIALVAFR